MAGKKKVGGEKDGRVSERPNGRADGLASGRTDGRPYDLGKRRVASDAARVRCLDAAKELLREGGASGWELTMEEVARRAGTTRQTVYNFFGSRAQLVEAVFDDLARSGGMEGMAGAMQQGDAEVRLREMVAVMARFWGADRAVMRRIRALAVTDEVLIAAVRARDERRRMACRRVAGGLGAGDGLRAGLRVDALFALTSFEFFDALAGEGRTPVEVKDVVAGLARAAMGLG